MSVLILLVASLAAEPADALSHLNDKALLACAESADRCNASTWDLARELSRRLEPAKLLAEYRRSTGQRRRMLVFALYLTAPSAPVKDVMRALSRDPDQEIAHYALSYRAKQCDPKALATLSGRAYLVRAPCEQWAATVELFGKCHYTKSGPFLVDTLSHGCLNVAAAARSSLKALFPDAPAQFESPEAERAYYKARVERRR